jgi:hypothetical protein
MNAERVREEEKRLAKELPKSGFPGIREWVKTFWDSGTGQLCARIILWNKGFKELCTEEGMEYLVKKYGPPRPQKENSFWF